jgi:hypothetical protein
MDKENYKKALLKLRDKGHLRSTNYLQMLKAQYSSDKHTITATNLANAVGFQNFNAANLQYGTMAHLIADYLLYIPPLRKDGTPMWFLTLSEGNDASDETVDGHFEFVMRSELVEALEEMKWVR